MTHFAHDHAHADAPCVTTVARVVRVRARDHGGWRVRLADTGGALAAAEIRLPAVLPLPRRNARILISGRLRYDAGHEWYTIDPVHAWGNA